MMEAKFKIGETLIIVDGPDESKIGREVVVIDIFHFVWKSKVKESAYDEWEYKVKEGSKSLGWITEYHLEPLNKLSIKTMKKDNRKRTIRIRGGIMLPHDVQIIDDFALFNKVIKIAMKK